MLKKFFFWVSANLIDLQLFLNRNESNRIFSMDFVHTESCLLLQYLYNLISFEIFQRFEIIIENFTNILHKYIDCSHLTFRVRNFFSPIGNYLLSFQIYRSISIKTFWNRWQRHQFVESVRTIICVTIFLLVQQTIWLVTISEDIQLNFAIDSLKLTR